MLWEREKTSICPISHDIWNFLKNDFHQNDFILGIIPLSYISNGTGRNGKLDQLSPFATMLSKVVCFWLKIVKMIGLLGNGLTLNQTIWTFKNLNIPLPNDPKFYQSLNKTGL